MFTLLRTAQGLFLFILFTAPVRAQPSPQPEAPPATSAAFVPNERPVLPVVRAAGPVRVDGALDDPGWRGIVPATNFAETFPGDLTRPPVDVEAFVTYDDRHLYLAFHIHDDPGRIRATLSDRDRIWNDDYAGILLDTNGDGQQVYFIAANPLGVQGDTRSANGQEDVSFDLVYQSAGRITDDGYMVEMAVPFRSLRFPKQAEQTWRATFWITHPRESRSTYSWAAISRDDPCFSCQFGTLAGIRGVSSGNNLEILPAFTGSQAGALAAPSDPASGFFNQRVQVEPSVNVKYGITSDLTADLTLNPDFSQIEADAAQVDVNSTFALFFPERRPFFQEGSDLFRTPFNAVYTRSINDPIVANKLTGRFGATSVAYIGARDNTSPVLLPFEESSSLASAGKSVSNILRVQHNFPDNSYLGALVTDRRLDDGGAGSVVGLDGTVRFLRNFRLSGQLLLSRTVEPDDPDLTPFLDGVTFDGGRHTATFDGETFGGHAFNLGLGRDARTWNFNLEYEQFSPTFRADNGFITANDSRRLTLFQGLNLYPETIGFIDRVRPGLWTGSRWNFGGVNKQRWLVPNVFFMLKKQTTVWMGYRFASERFAGVDFSGVRRFMLDVNSNFSEPVKVGLNLGRGLDIARTTGDPELGRSFDLTANATLRPTQRLLIQPRITYAELRDRETGEAFFSGYIARSRVDYQVTRRLFGRVIVQYNDFSDRLEVDPLLTYRINPFTAFHVGSTHDYDTFSRADAGSYLRQTSRQFFFKFQYLFRV